MSGTKHSPFDGDTKNKILETAARLFALKGFKAVTLGEIAKEVGIKIASIYYYYSDKDALIADVLENFGAGYKKYHDWLARRNERAESLEDVISNLFDREHFENVTPIVRLGMSMTMKEQHSHKSAFRNAYKNFYLDGIENIQNGFDRLIEKGIIPPSDTKTLATLFMFVVMSGNDILIHELTEFDVPVDPEEVYAGLKQLITAALRQGILKADQ